MLVGAALIDAVLVGSGLIVVGLVLDNCWFSGILLRV